MSLSKQEIDHIAKLARLSLTEEEEEKYSRELSSILDFVEKMNGVNTDQVEETSQVTGLKNVMREDEVVESGVAEALTAVSPENNDGYIKVPKILEK